MAIDRTTILKGPGSVTFDGATLHDANGITAEIETPTMDVPSSISGSIDTLKTDQTGTVSFTPAGEVSVAILAALFPHQTPVIGSSIFGAADKPIVVHSLAGTKVTFTAGALTQPPEIILSPVATAFGAATLSAVVGKGKGPDTLAALYAVEAAAYAGGGPDPAGIGGNMYTGTWGTTVIADTAAGWRVTIELQTSPIVTDSVGTVDMVLEGVTVRASCQPVGLTESALLEMLPASKARGSSLRGANDLVISAPAPGLTVTLRNAALLTGPLAWGTSQLRIGEIGFLAHREFSAGTPGDLYTITATAVSEG